MNTTKQYTITEYNDWEGETFGYIMDLTDDEVALITKGLAESEFHSIEPSSHTPEDVALVKKHDTNGYMDRLGFYEFKEPLEDMINSETDRIKGYEGYTDDETLLKYTKLVTSILEFDIFYKGLGLKRIKK